MVKQEEEEAVSVETKLVEKEVVEEVKVTTPLPTVEVVEEKEDVVKVDRSESSPAPLERLKGWMDERDAQENFESSIEEFKAKLAAAQDASSSCCKINWKRANERRTAKSSERSYFVLPVFFYMIVFMY